MINHGYRILVTSSILAIVGCSAVPQKPADEPSSRPEAAYLIKTGLEYRTTENFTRHRQSSPAADADPEDESVAITDPSFPAEVEIEEETIATGPEDLWSRLRNGFSLRIPDNQRIQREIEWFSRHQEYLDRVQERALPYLYFILEEAEARDLPTELALLPVVESAFQPFAYSPGRASGMWQFIPSTGRIYGLKQNWWYDGRRDVYASTKAALDYLKALGEIFDGDWELALASYNAGAGTVKKAIRKNRRRGKPTDFWSLDLPRETSNYVPRLLAISSLVATPDHHGVIFHALDDEPYFASVDIGSQLDLALAADMAEISVEELYRLNPGFNRWATDPDGPHRLLVPVEQAESFEKALADLDPNQRLRWERYRIKNGDTLSVIARRHGTTVALLKQVNKLRGSRIRAGKHLIIPSSSKQLNQYALSASQRLKRIKETPRSGAKHIHTVQPGDTLWDIARLYGVSYRKLARWNGMAPGDTLRLGQELAVWTKDKTDHKKEIAALPARISERLDVKPVTGPSRLSYRVRKGDSLARIADRFNVTVRELRRWNTLPGKYLQPGQLLTLHVDVTKSAL